MNARESFTIWIDMDNSPHVVFFLPIIKELKRLGYTIVITVRDCSQALGLARYHGLTFTKIGKHYGKNKIMKIIGLVIRSLSMIPFVIQHKPRMALSHGSRSQLFLAKMIGLRSILMADYEYASSEWLTKPNCIIVPDVVARASRIRKNFKQILSYPGIKEDVYVPHFQPNPLIKKQLMIADSDIMVTIRPPAIDAHYFKPDSELLFNTVIATLAKIKSVKMVILPRNHRQEKIIQEKWPQLLESRKIIIPETVVDGLNLMWNSDLVISGGGTMNREAAALNTPVYSIFRGDIGAVDQYLANEKRLVLVNDAEDIKNKIVIKKRVIPSFKETSESETLKSIVKSIVQIAETV